MKQNVVYVHTVFILDPQYSVNRQKKLKVVLNKWLMNGQLCNETIYCT